MRKALLAVLFVLCRLAGAQTSVQIQHGTIQAGTGFGSYVQCPLNPSNSAVTFSVTPSSFVGNLACYVGDRSNPTVWSQVSTSMIVNVSTGAAGAPSGAVAGTYRVVGTGGATFKVAASSYTSGSVVVDLNPGSGGFVLAGSNVGQTLYVDLTYGSDNTGQRGFSSLPFATLHGANKASKWGDTIVVGPGVVPDAVNQAAMAGRNYILDPGTILPDPTLAAPPLTLTDLSVVTTSLPSNATWSSTCTSASLAAVTGVPGGFTSDYIGRTIWITGGGAGVITGPALIVNVVAGTATLNAPFGSASSTITETGTLEPGPMWTAQQWTNSPLNAGGFTNGQMAGLLVLMLFDDSKELYTDSAVNVANPGTDSVRTVKPPYRPGAPGFPYSSSQPNFTNSGGSSNDPTWEGSYIQMTNASNYLTASVSGTSNYGQGSMIIGMANPGSLPTAGNYPTFAGSNTSGSFLAFELNAAPNALAGVTNGYQGYTYTIANPALFNVYCVRQFQYATATSVSGVSDLYVGNSLSAAGTSAGSNTTKWSGVSVGLFQTQAQALGVQISHFAFFDGAIGPAKRYAWTNAFLNDQGNY